MKIAILDDYQNVVSKLVCFKMLEGRNVIIFKEFRKRPQNSCK
jgi:hypothetical protein